MIGPYIKAVKEAEGRIKCGICLLEMDEKDWNEHNARHIREIRELR